MNDMKKSRVVVESATAAVAADHDCDCQPCQALVKYDPGGFYLNIDAKTLSRKDKFAIMGYAPQWPLRKKTPNVQTVQLSKEEAEAKKCEEARLERARKISAIEALLKDEDCAPWGIEHDVIRAIYAFFVWLGLAVPWKDIIRLRQLAKQRHFEEYDTKVIRLMENEKLEEQIYMPGTARYLHLKKLSEFFIDIARLFKQLPDDDFTPDEVGIFARKEMEALTWSSELSAKISPQNSAIEQEPQSVLEEGGVRADMNVPWRDTGCVTQTQQLSDVVEKNISRAKRSDVDSKAKYAVLTVAFDAAAALYNNFVLQEKITFVSKYRPQTAKDITERIDSQTKYMEAQTKDLDLSHKVQKNIQELHAGVIKRRAKWFLFSVAVVLLWFEKFKLQKIWL